MAVGEEGIEGGAGFSAGRGGGDAYQIEAERLGTGVEVLSKAVRRRAQKSRSA